MSVQSHSFVSVSPDQTSDLAKRLGASLRPGDTLLLDGQVGAGKTHFARAVIQDLILTPEDVPSPTYTLVQTYDARVGEIWHADLYRLTDLSEIEELGLLQAFEGAICLVEWPDRLHDLTPDNAMNIQFAQGDAPDCRQITFNWSNPRWTSIIEGLVDD
ncbi:MAG: tRNA (adenosine(37)-N6)-threonylcarbamoyltransferase complex ATPase subunit type 1 TsaE [Roseovarius sp.]